MLRDKACLMNKLRENQRGTFARARYLVDIRYQQPEQMERTTNLLLQLCSSARRSSPEYSGVLCVQVAGDGCPGQPPTQHLRAAHSNAAKAGPAATAHAQQHQPRRRSSQGGQLLRLCLTWPAPCLTCNAILRMIAEGPRSSIFTWHGLVHSILCLIVFLSICPCCDWDAILRLGLRVRQELILHAAPAESSLRPPQPPAMARSTASLGSEEVTPSTAAPATPAVDLHGVTSPWGRESAVTIGSRVGDGLISRYESRPLPASVQGTCALDSDYKNPGQCCTMAFLHGTLLTRLAHKQVQLRLECCARTLMQSGATGSNHVHRWWSLGETSAHVQGAQMMGKPSVAFRKARRHLTPSWKPCVGTCHV